ncbi:MAG: histidinol dehydrogenase [Actinobacteria bacterium]|nr:histidinol dehydrogenase [Actinomycetota bacterium]
MVQAESVPVVWGPTASVGCVLNRLDLRGRSGAALTADLPRPDPGGDGPIEAVRAIIAAVRERGDDAVREFTETFDGVSSDSFVVTRAELEEALATAPTELVAALTAARDAVLAFHEAQVRSTHTFTRDGITVTGRSVPVDRAGCYVPGGRGSYPSSVIMTAVPARVAGVPEVVLCVPPDRATGAVAQATLVAAALAGVDEVYAIGGAQAIAAMAYGTDTIRPVDVIAGPGNVFVAIAKREVAGQVGVPMAFAGPSEIVVVADDSAPVDFVAIDLMVQAEHGPDGLAWLVTWQESVADAVDAALSRLVAQAPRQAEITSTFERGGFCALVDGPEAALAVVNHIAPEHLELITVDPAALVPDVRHAGAVFLGPLAPASIGDYVAGPSHVLPTFGSARYGSALTVDDFTKQVHVIELTRQGFDQAAPVVAVLADTEGFAAHADSVRLRQRSLAEQDGAAR